MNAVVDMKQGCVVQGTGSYTSQQGSVYAQVISAETVGARAVYVGLVTIPPQGRTRARVHESHDSVSYLLSGEAVELCAGPRLEHRETARAGDRGHAARAGCAGAMSQPARPKAISEVRSTKVVQ